MTVPPEAVAISESALESTGRRHRVEYQILQCLELFGRDHALSILMSWISLNTLTVHVLPTLKKHLKTHNIDAS